MRQIRPIFTPPRPELASYVRNYWWVPPCEEVQTGTMQADGDVGLELIATGMLGGQDTTQPLCWDGPCSAARPVRLEPATTMLGVRFHPGGFFRLFGVAVHSSLETAFGLSTMALAEKVSQRPFLKNTKKESAFATFDELLATRLLTPDKQHPAIKIALAHIARERQAIELSELIEESTLSRRQFERLFRQQVGLPPARYLRLQRLNAARAQLKSGAPSLAKVASDSGFFDQAHLNREFRRSLKDSPVAYRERPRGGLAPSSMGEDAE